MISSAVEMPVLSVREATQVEAFLSRTLVVPVVRYGKDPGPWVVNAEKADDLRRLVSRSMAFAQVPDAADDLLTELMAAEFSDDLWYTQMPDGAVVVLAHKHITDALEERDIASHVHSDAVDAAWRRGDAVSPELLHWSHRVLGLGAPSENARSSR